MLKNTKFTFENGCSNLSPTLSCPPRNKRAYGLPHSSLTDFLRQALRTLLGSRSPCIGEGAKEVHLL